MTNEIFPRGDDETEERKETDSGTETDRRKSLSIGGAERKPRRDEGELGARDENRKTGREGKKGSSSQKDGGRYKTGVGVRVERP